MSDQAKEEITLSEEHKEAALRHYTEALNSLNELAKVISSALRENSSDKRHRELTVVGYRPKSTANVREVVVMSETERPGVCICQTRDENGVPHSFYCPCPK
jgi:hypothetical protein